MADVKTYSVLNFTEDDVVINNTFLGTGKSLVNISLTEADLELYYRRGLLILDPVSGLSFAGPPGPAAYATPVYWQPNTDYTNIAPASVVSYLGTSYICVVAHTSGNTFELNKFVVLASQGAEGVMGGQGQPGIQGNTGLTPWQPLDLWAAGATYTSDTPASTVTYLGTSYVCIASHTASSSFDGTKWRVIAQKGDVGAIGPTGATPWKPLVAWATGTAYTNVAPASVVSYLGSSYLANTAHVSGSTFDASKWTLLASRGNTIITGTTAPSNTSGVDGDYYIYNRTGQGQSRLMYGPKSGGIWPTTPWVIEVVSYSDVPGLVDQLNLKATKEDVYLKTQTYQKNEVYSRAETYSRTETYTKDEINQLITANGSGGKGNANYNTGRFLFIVNQ